MNKTLTVRGTARRIAVQIDAEYLELDIQAVDGLQEPSADLTGPQDVIDRIRETRDGDMWTLSWPRDGRSYGGGTIIQTGGFMSAHMSGGRGRGRTIINGVDVTDMIRDAAGEPVRATIRVPSGSALIAKIDSGSIRASGTLTGIRANTVSADIRCSSVLGGLEATTVSGDVTTEVVGPANVGTTSGDVKLGGARGAVHVRTVSGDVEVHVLESVIVNTNTVSGDIRVTAAPGARPAASGNSISGDVRLPR